ncbi:MAG: radical SAM protein [Kiritimatiellae bacterium]|nr:radical SAM protein [Verrucomicrobiota bacterium]MCG2661143.1 radical SAM protein [Kiritimatiellia bacterium]
MSDFLQVCETFVSIQGESTFAGGPCFFIRLTGCNLRCSYCDTTYAFTGGQPKTIPQLVDEFRVLGLTLVEVTGGEPLIQPGTPALLKALQAARSGAVVLVETNGSRDISVVPPGVIAIMDIKCPASGAGDAFDWQNLERLRPQDEVKFVISERADFDWAVRIVNEHAIASKCHAVLFSPVSGRVEPAALAEWLIASRVPARLSLQLHKLMGIR